MTTDPKRYSLVPQYDDRGAGEFRGYEFAEEDDGDYVLHSDFAALQAERDGLRTALISCGRLVGATLSDDASSQFLGFVPGEVGLVVKKIQAERDALRKENEWYEQSLQKAREMHSLANQNTADTQGDVAALVSAILGTATGTVVHPSDVAKCVTMAMEGRVERAALTAENMRLREALLTAEGSGCSCTGDDHADGCHVMVCRAALAKGTP